MARSADQIIDEAKLLTPEERIRVAEEILRTVPTPERDEIEKAWVAEAEARLDRYLANETIAITADEAIQQVRARLSQRHAS